MSKCVLPFQPARRIPKASGAWNMRRQTLFHSTPLQVGSKRPATIPSSASSSATPRKATDTYRQGTRPQFAENLVAPFASESIDDMYTSNVSHPSYPFETPADHSSSTSVDPPHPATTAKLQHTGEEAVGSSASVRYREPSWDDKSGGNYGVGLQDENAVVKNKGGSKLPEVNAGPDEEQGKKGLEAWKGRK